MSVTSLPSGGQTARTSYAVILAISFCHFLNDVMQSLLAAIYPILKEGYGLEFWQIGLLTFTFQGTASLLQPLIGMMTDRRPMPYSLPAGMASTLVGLLLIAHAHDYGLLLFGAALIGLGSAVFHPEASRVARLASGGRYGLAQSMFQVGGNFGTAIGPLLAAFIVVQRGQESVGWFSLAAMLGMVVLWRVGAWYSRITRAAGPGGGRPVGPDLSRRRVALALAVLTLLVFAKNIYTATFASYYTFYAMETHGVSVQHAQVMLFLFLGAMAVGTLIGGPIGDRIGARNVIWFSILGVLPFTLALPHADLAWSAVLTVLIGLIMASAFPAIVVFGQELIPGRVGMVAGIFFGLAFGSAAIGAALLGIVADIQGIRFVFVLTSFLPFLGLLTVLLPRARDLRAA